MTFNIATWMNIESTGRWFYASEFEPAQLQDRPYSVLLLRKLAGKMEHKIKMQMMENPKFAQMLAINITGTVYNFFGYKVQMRENINIAIKGATRSGKSTTGNSWGIYISGLTGVPFDPEKNVCANESEYIQRVKDASFNECFLIDEQKEAKFGAGSFREEMSIMDVQNIIAKKCIHTIWVYPSDFISRNSDYGFETYGRDIIHKLARLIVYDVRKSMFGIQQPVGICLVPKFQDPVYQKIPKELWSPYRLKNAELKRPDFDSLHEERYEIKKDSWIDREQHGQMGYHHEMRYKEGVKLGELPVFQTAPNKKRQRIIARQMFRNLTEAEIDEVVEIARMGISFDDLQAALSGKIIKKQDDGEDMGDDVAEEDDEGNGEEFSVDAQKSECVHSSVEPVAKCKEIQDDEEDRVEMIGEESEEEDSGREGVVMKEHAVDSEDLIRLKQDLGAYNPGSRKLRVRVVADEPENASGHADNLPETKG